MKYLPLAARICLSLIFLKAGISHIIGYNGTVEMMAGKGLPIPDILLIFTIIFQLLGGLALILGYKIQIGSLLLIIFLIPATLAFHNPVSDLNGFLKNIGLIGGLLMVMYAGAGTLSIDSLLNKKERKKSKTESNFTV